MIAPRCAGGALAALLAAARRDGRQVRDSLPHVLVPPDADAAYAVNAEVAALARLGAARLEDRRHHGGGARAPRDGRAVSGAAFRRFALSLARAAPPCGLLDPLVECEFFATLAREPAAPRRAWTMAEVRSRAVALRATAAIDELRGRDRPRPPTLPGLLGAGAHRHRGGPPRSGPFTIFVPTDQASRAIRRTFRRGCFPRAARRKAGDDGPGRGAGGGESHILDGRHPASEFRAG